MDCRSIQITHMPLVAKKLHHEHHEPSVLQSQRASALRDNSRANGTSYLQDVMPREWRELWLWEHLLNSAFVASQIDFINPAHTIFTCMQVCKAWHTELGARLLQQLVQRISSSCPQRHNLCAQIGTNEYESFFRFLSKLNNPEHVYVCAMHISSTNSRHRRKKSICICTHSYPVKVRLDLSVPLAECRCFMVIFVTQYVAGKVGSQKIIVTEVDKNQHDKQHRAQQMGSEFTKQILTLVTPQLA